MGAFKFSSKPIFIPREVVTDANLNVLEEMLSALLARIARTQNLKYTKGTGAGEPIGFLLNATGYSAGAVALDLRCRLEPRLHGSSHVPASGLVHGIGPDDQVPAKAQERHKRGQAGVVEGRIIREAEQGASFTYRYDCPAKDGSAVVAFKRSDSKLVVPTAIAKRTV